MRNEMAVPIMQEILEQRRALSINEPLRITKGLGIGDALDRADFIRLAAELIVLVERIDMDRVAERAAEIRRRIQGDDADDDDVLRSPFGRGRVG